MIKTIDFRKLENISELEPLSELEKRNSNPSILDNTYRKVKKLLTMDGMREAPLLFNSLVDCINAKTKYTKTIPGAVMDELELYEHYGIIIVWSMVGKENLFITELIYGNRYVTFNEDCHTKKSRYLRGIADNEGYVSLYENKSLKLKINA